MEESPQTIYASLCGVGKHHRDRGKAHNFLKVHNICAPLASVSNISSKSRCVLLNRHLVTADKNKVLASNNQLTIEDLCLPQDFVPQNNVDRRNPVELLNALYIGKAQAYYVWFSFLAAFSRSGVPFQMFWAKREKSGGRKK